MHDVHVAGASCTGKHLEGDARSRSIAGQQANALQLLSLKADPLLFGISLLEGRVTSAAAEGGMYHRVRHCLASLCFCLQLSAWQGRHPCDHMELAIQSRLMHWHLFAGSAGVDTCCWLPHVQQLTHCQVALPGCNINV